MKKKPSRFRILSADKIRQNALMVAGNMRYSDLKAACIIRGMNFDEILDGDHNSLHSFFLNAYVEGKPVNKELLTKFDKYQDKQLKGLGYKKSHPLRKFKQFSYIGEESNDGNGDTNVTKIKGSVKRKAGLTKLKRQKKERDQFNLFTGTKKSYTYSLGVKAWNKFKHKYDAKQIFKKFVSQAYNKVQAKFPDASEKSVNIWFKKALNEIEKKEGKTHK